MYSHIINISLTQKNQVVQFWLVFYITVFSNCNTFLMPTSLIGLSLQHAAGQFFLVALGIHFSKVQRCTKLLDINMYCIKLGLHNLEKMTNFD